ncbi:unnamed protein product [Linum trigynum]|uniref:Uncharacterized protein n=1 Tax=Linum trigynum TaxID=586398 RepID=A0AAV2C719_9ROSI
MGFISTNCISAQSTFGSISGGLGPILAPRPQILPGLARISPPQCRLCRIQKASLAVAAAQSRTISSNSTESQKSFPPTEAISSSSIKTLF